MPRKRRRKEDHDSPGSTPAPPVEGISKISLKSLETSEMISTMRKGTRMQLKYPQGTEPWADNSTAVAILYPRGANSCRERTGVISDYASSMQDADESLMETSGVFESACFQQRSTVFRASGYLAALKRTSETSGNQVRIDPLIESEPDRLRAHGHVYEDGSQYGEDWHRRVRYPTNMSQGRDSSYPRHTGRRILDRHDGTRFQDHGEDDDSYDQGFLGRKGSSRFDDDSLVQLNDESGLPTPSEAMETSRRYEDRFNDRRSHHRRNFRDLPDVREDLNQVEESTPLGRQRRLSEEMEELLQSDLQDNAASSARRTRQQVCETNERVSAVQNQRTASNSVANVRKHRALPTHRLVPRSQHPVPPSRVRDATGQTWVLPSGIDPVVTEVFEEQVSTMTSAKNRPHLIRLLQRDNRFSHGHCMQCDIITHKRQL